MHYYAFYNHYGNNTTDTIEKWADAMTYMERIAGIDGND